MYKIIWKLFGKGLKTYMLTHKPIGFDDLEFAFTDTNGKKYYRFCKSVGITLERYLKLEYFITIASLKLSEEQLKTILDEMKRWIHDGLKKQANAVKLAALVNMLEDRAAYIAPIDVMYNILALQFVREDENPQIYSDDVQLQKVKLLSAEAQSNDSFFFRLPELEQLPISLNMSAESWEEYSKNSIMQQEMIQKMLIPIQSYVQQ